MTVEPLPAADEPARPIGTRLVLVHIVLSLMYVLSFTDRFALALLVDPLKADLHLTDIQVGFLFGTAFAAFYALTALPLARLADKGNRKRLIIVCVLVWSACTAASALVTSFTMLAVLRCGLAIGESALVPAAMSLLTDALPPRRRLQGLTLFATAGMLGAATSYLIGGFVIQLATQLKAGGMLPGWHVWQLTLVGVALPGVVLAALLAIFGKEPARTGVDDVGHASFASIWEHVRENGWLYPGLFLGAGFTQFIGYTMVAWGPTFLQRDLALTAVQSGYGFGIAHFIAAVGGTLTIPLLVRRLAARGYYRLGSRLPATLAAIGAALIAVAPFTGSAFVFLSCHALGGLLLVGTGNMILLVLQPTAPARMRAILSACVLICYSGLGLGTGPPLAAFITRQAGGTPAALGWGLSGVALIGLVGSAVLLSLAAPRFRRALPLIV